MNIIKYTYQTRTDNSGVENLDFSIKLKRNLSVSDLTPPNSAGGKGRVASGPAGYLPSPQSPSALF